MIESLRTQAGLESTGGCRRDLRRKLAIHGCGGALVALLATGLAWAQAPPISDSGRSGAPRLRSQTPEFQAAKADTLRGRSGMLHEAPQTDSDSLSRPGWDGVAPRSPARDGFPANAGGPVFGLRGPYPGGDEDDRLDRGAPVDPLSTAARDAEPLLDPPGVPALLDGFRAGFRMRVSGNSGRPVAGSVLRVVGSSTGLGVDLGGEPGDGPGVQAGYDALAGAFNLAFRVGF